MLDLHAVTMHPGVTRVPCSLLPFSLTGSHIHNHFRCFLWKTMGTSVSRLSVILHEFLDLAIFSLVE